MIIGRGNLASVLNDRGGAIFFASGVSNSQCSDEKAYDREKDLLKVIYNSRLSLFYFSSIMVNYSKSRYAQHKLAMEYRVKKNFLNYNIIRLGNLDWDTNPNTFVNYLRAHPESEIKDEYRYMISKEQLLLITNNLPLIGKHEISVFGEMRKVRDCI